MVSATLNGRRTQGADWGYSILTSTSSLHKFKTIKMGSIPRRTLKTRPGTPHASVLRSMVLQSTAYVTQWTVTDEKKVQLKGKVQK